MMDLAATRGHLRIVQFLHERGEACTTKAMDNAALGGHLHGVQFLHQHRTEGCTRRAMNIAIIRRDFSLVRFLHENRSEGYDVEVLDALDEYHTRSVDRIVGLLAPNRPMDDNSRRMRLERQAKNPLQGLFKEVDEYDDDSDSDLEELLDASIVQSSE